MATRQTSRKAKPEAEADEENEPGGTVTTVTTRREVKPISEAESDEEKGDLLQGALADSEMTEAEALAAAISALDAGSESKLVVYRQPGSGQQRMQFLFAINTTDIAVEDLLSRIQNEYGGGEYRVHARANSQLIFNKPVSIAPPLKKEVAPVQDKTGELMQQVYAQQNAQMAELMKAVVTRPQADNSAMMKLFIPILTAMAPKIFEFMTSRADPMAQFGAMLGLLEKVKPLMGDQPAPEGIMGLAQQFMPMIQSAIEGMKNAQPVMQVPAQIPQQLSVRQMAPVPRISQTQTAPAGPVHIPAPSRSENSMVSDGVPRPTVLVPGTASQPAVVADPFSELRPYLKMLLSGAARQVDPADFALGLMDVMPQDILDALAPMVQSAEAFEMLFTIEPKLASARQWCDAVRQQLLEHLDVSPHVPARNPGGPSAPSDGDGQAVGGRDRDGGNPGADDAAERLGQVSA